MTARIEKTVFISYRRANLPWALNIYQDLTHHGYDVFFDYQSINSGDFEKIILDNIKARAHFIVVLTPSALERCKEPNDWLRREIETAIDEKRNIVPLMMEGFDFSNTFVMQALTGKLATLSNKNGLPIYAAYFFEGMEKLRNQYLDIALSDVPLRPLSSEAQEVTEAQKTAASEASPVNKEQLSAQEWFERGYVLAENKDLDESIKSYTKAIQLNPNNPYYYLNRGSSKGNMNEYDQAIVDINQAIYLKSDFAEAYYCRGLVYGKKADFTRAIDDFNEAIHLKPDYADAFYSRGLAYGKKDEYTRAIDDFEKAIRLKPDYADAFYGRGLAYGKKDEYTRAIDDFDKVLVSANWIG